MPQYDRGEGIAAGITGGANSIASAMLLKAQLARQEYQRQQAREQEIQDRNDQWAHEKDVKQQTLDQQDLEFRQGQEAWKRANESTGAGAKAMGGIQYHPQMGLPITEENPNGQYSPVKWEGATQKPPAQYREQFQERLQTGLGGLNSPRQITGFETAAGKGETLPTYQEGANALLSDPDADPKTPGWQPNPDHVKQLLESGVPQEHIDAAIVAGRKAHLEERAKEADIAATNRSNQPKVEKPKDLSQLDNKLWDKLDKEIELNSYEEKMRLDPTNPKAWTAENAPNPKLVGFVPYTETEVEKTAREKKLATAKHQLARMKAKYGITEDDSAPAGGEIPPEIEALVKEYEAKGIPRKVALETLGYAGN